MLAGGVVSADVSKQQLTVGTRVLTLLAWKHLTSVVTATVKVQTLLLNTETGKQQDIKLLWQPQTTPSISLQRVYVTTVTVTVCGRSQLAPSPQPITAETQTG